MAGQSGDYLAGWLASAVALASAVLFFGAILLQREELRLQREELRLSREVSKAQVEELAAQTEIARHSALLSQILDVIRLRATLEIEGAIATGSKSGTQAWAEVQRQRIATEPYLLHLLKSRNLTDAERDDLVLAANLVKQFAPTGNASGN